MRLNSSMRRYLKTVGTSLAVITLGLGFAQQAGAGCLQYQPPRTTVSDWRAPESAFGSAKFVKAAYLQVSDEEYSPGFFRAEITGLWSFKYISKGNANKPKPINIPDGAIVDGGVTTFNADGNELTYSGMRDPTTGAVCLGVWRQTGERTYVLNHIGLSWNPPGNAEGAPVGPGGPAFIKQHIILDRGGNSYTGTFSINQLLPDGKTPALPGEITGTIVATRVMVQTETLP
jgi:hypothetical protein